MKNIFTSIILCILCCVSYAQESIIVYQGTNLQKFPLATIDSITHTGGNIVNIYQNSQVFSYSVDNIDSIFFPIQDREIRFCSIEKGDLDNWDEGYILYNEQDEASSLYVLGKYKVEDDNYVVHFNKLGNTDAEDGITFYFDSDKNIQTIFINSLCYSAFIEEKDAILYVGIDKDGNVIDSFSLESSYTRLNASRIVNRSIIEGINSALDARTITQVLDHFGKGEYGEVIATIGPDALVGTLNLDPKSKLITTLLIEALNRIYFNTIKNDFYDGCTPKITNVTHDKITVSIAGVENLRDWCSLEFTQLGTSKKVFLVVAIGDGGSNGYVTFSNCKWKTSQIQINKNSSTVEVPLPSNLKIGTYYLRPLLITDQVLDKRLATVREWYIQYGATEKFKYPNIIINEIKQNSCRYYDYDHDYSVDLTIDSEIDGFEGVTAWGIKVYNDKGNVEKEVTTNSTNNKYSFHYQDIVPEEAFDKKTQSAEFVIVPFAIGKTSNDKVYCEGVNHIVKVDQNIEVSFYDCSFKETTHLPTGSGFICGAIFNASFRVKGGANISSLQIVPVGNFYSWNGASYSSINDGDYTTTITCQHIYWSGLSGDYYCYIVAKDKNGKEYRSNNIIRLSHDGEHFVSCSLANSNSVNNSRTAVRKKRKTLVHP